MSLRSTMPLVAAVILSCFVNQVFAQGAGQNWHNFSGGGWHHAGGFGPGNPGNLGLVVRQTDEVHEQVGNLLDQLRTLQGQSVLVSTPFTTVNDSFYERIGVNFGFNLRGGGNVVGLDPFGNPTPNGDIQFRQGSFDAAIPAFGGFDANAQATAGAAILGGAGDVFLGFAAGTGSNRTIVTQTPIVNLMNGQPGFVSDSSVRPFVTSVIPVVGGTNFPTPPWPSARPTQQSMLKDTIQQYYQQQEMLKKTGTRIKPSLPVKTAKANFAPEDKLSLKLAASRGSSAGQGDFSVAEIRRRKAALDQAKEAVSNHEVLALIEQARGAEDIGKSGLAKLYYQQAERRATGELKQELAEKIEALSHK